MNLKPDMYKNNIYNINYKKLFDMNKKYLFFDFDNTIISYEDNKLSKKNLDLFKKLKKMGFECFIISNSNYKRISKFSEQLNIEVYYNSMKPLKKNYRKILKKFNREKCAFIGDQLMTDVLGAKRNNLFVILVDRIGLKEPFTTKMCRLIEKIFLYNMKKKKIFEKGRYYD